MSAVGGTLTAAQRAELDRRWNACVDFGSPMSAWTPEMLKQAQAVREADAKAAQHYQTGRGTLCSLDNDASRRTPTADPSTVTCTHCRELMRINAAARAASASRGHSG